MTPDASGVAASGFHPTGRPALVARTGTLLSSDRLVWVALALLWVLTHPFVGTIDDARIYMGRVLADLYPDGVGRDLMFVMDGQSGFTIFRWLARTCAAHWGLGATVAMLTGLNLMVWFFAIAVFARTIAPGRAALVVLAAAIVLPRLYTPWNLLSAGESIPEPRPLAEACVLLALAALLSGRRSLCLASLLVAACIHPIMAAPGFGVLLIVLAQGDRRWLLAAAACAAAVVAAGFLGLPLAYRLLATIDTAWRAILVDRTPYLFVTHWPIETLAPIVVRGVTLALACLWLAPKARTLILASVAVALIGVAMSAVLGDGLSDTLVLQAQPWRTLWLPTVLSTIAAGLCLVHLPRQGKAGQIALCLLALAWFAIDASPIGPAAALLAFASVVGLPRLSFVITRTPVILVGAGCAILATALLWDSTRAVITIAASLPDLPMAWKATCALHLLVAPVLALVILWWRRPDTALARGGAALSVCVVGLLLATQWNARTADQADVDAATYKPDLAALLARRPGSVLWSEGDEAWTWLHAANWTSPIQGSSIVFSRALATQWRGRAEAVVQSGLATASLLRPLIEPASPDVAPLDATRIERFCAQPDRPAWIVAPLRQGAAPPPVLQAMIWSPPHPRGRSVLDGENLRWLPFARYALIPCSDPDRQP